jgi:pimeloyl-ACP methyl ester carboxylesterase
MTRAAPPNNSGGGLTILKESMMTSRFARAMKKALSSFALFTVILVSTLAAWAAWERNRDPLGAIDRDLGSLFVLQDSSFAFSTDAGEQRTIREMTLQSATGEQVRIALSLPQTQRAGPRPVLVILGGFASGRQSLNYVPEHGDNVLVGYEYPYRKRSLKPGQIPAEVFAVRRAVIRVPAQVVALTRWLHAHEWADAQRTSLLGFSFGGFFVPSIWRVAECQDMRFAAVSMGFAGVDVDALLRQNLKLQPDWVRHCVAWLAATSIHVVEPQKHVGHLTGNVLLINGAHDEMIPMSSALRLQEMVPKPKTIVNLDTHHLNRRNPALVRRVATITQSWLAERDLLNVD